MLLDPEQTLSGPWEAWAAFSWLNSEGRNSEGRRLILRDVFCAVERLAGPGLQERTSGPLTYA